MTCDEIIKELKSNASEKYKANVIKMGIPAEYSIGVSTAVVRAVAKKAGRSNELANELCKNLIIKLQFSMYNLQSKQKKRPFPCGFRDFSLLLYECSYSDHLA